MRYFIAIICAVLLGPVASYFSGLIKIASSDAELQTIGLISYRGFPIWFYEQAPGLSIMSGWHFDRLYWNTAAWIVSLFFLFIFMAALLRGNKNTAEQGAAANP